MAEERGNTQRNNSSRSGISVVGSIGAVLGQLTVEQWIKIGLWIVVGVSLGAVYFVLSGRRQRQIEEEEEEDEPENDADDADGDDDDDEEEEEEEEDVGEAVVTKETTVIFSPTFPTVIKNKKND